MTVASDAARLSVVVAARKVPDALPRCIDSLARQPASVRLEILLADGSPEGAMRAAVPASSRAVHLHLPGADLPRLKAHGIRRAAAPIIAVVDPTARVSPGWAERVLAAFDDARVQAVGGAVTLEDRRAPGNVAAYLFEYGAFNPPLAPGSTSGDLPGNNVAYRREALQGAGAVLDAEGFNKPFVHAVIRAAGGELHVVPDMHVTHMTHYGVVDVARRLFDYGRYFGSARLRQSSPPRRALYVAFAPAVPALLVARHLRRSLSLPQNRALLGTSVAALVVACTAWGAGEWVGSWFGAGRAEVA